MNPVVPEPKPTKGNPLPAARMVGRYVLTLLWVLFWFVVAAAALAMSFAALQLLAWFLALVKNALGGA